MTAQRKKGKVTLREVADQAGVSVTTASMVLNQRHGTSFSEETIVRVRLAAETLGYAGSGAATFRQSIFPKQTIGVFLPYVTGSYYATMARAASLSAYECQLDSIAVETHDDAQRELRALSSLCASNIAGLIFTYVPLNYQQVEEIARSIPVVVIGERNDSVRLDIVETDSYHMGALVAQHLLDLGHRHLAFVGTQPGWWGYSGAHRVAGVQETIAAAGPGVRLTTRIENSLQDSAGDTKQARREIGRRLSEACMADRSITGFIASSDYLAYGVLDTLHAHGYRVPEDYSVCGIDDVFSSSLPGVDLTTVSHHALQKGQRAFALLQQKITAHQQGARMAPEPVSILRVEYLSTLVVRGSSAKPRET